MIPLARQLDTSDFDGLVALARSQLPALARQWTDYNIHDPGIMLVELLAWLADSQIYSLSRNRIDERRAFLKLMGSRAGGASPARGLVFPSGAVQSVRPIARGASIRAVRGGLAPLEADAAITLLPLAVRHIAIGAEACDVTEINASGHIAFPAFGTNGDGDLRIALQSPGSVDGTAHVRLSLGFRVAHAGAGAAVGRFGRVGAFAADGRRLRRLRDTTLGLQRSGAMIFEIASNKLEAPIVLRPEAGYSLNPRLLSVQPNALPLRQRTTIHLDPIRGNGRPGQTIDIEFARLMADRTSMEGPAWRLVDGPAALRVVSVSPAGRELPWQPGRLDEAGPADRRFSLTEDGATGRLVLRFGNGVNGLRPELDERIVVILALCCGRSGGCAQPTEWESVAGGTRWRNPEAIAGGRDAQSLDEALAALRETAACRGPLVTSAQIEEAARSLPPALGVVRAHVEEGWERGRRAPAIAATRSLIVAGAEAGRESAAWLDAVRRRIVPRITLGERLLVVPPVYRRFALTLEITTTRGTRPQGVVAAVRKVLIERFDPPHQGPADRLDPAHEPWPFGRDVSAATVAGWVRNVAGVTRVLAVALMPEGQTVDSSRLVLGRGELPKLVGDPVVTVREPTR